jgi:hypothetical protein
MRWNVTQPSFTEATIHAESWFGQNDTGRRLGNIGCS